MSHKIVKMNKRRPIRSFEEQHPVPSTGKMVLDSTIKPMTKNQGIAFTQWTSGKNLLMHGIAGTGKTFLGLYFAIKEIISTDPTKKKVFIIRSVVPTRDMGFLPGTQAEKTKVYEGPYYDIFSKLFGRADAYDVFKCRDQVSFISTSFLRGITFNDCVIVVDEINNMTFGELDTVISRIGYNCKIIFCGDFRQSDLDKRDRQGLHDFMRILQKIKDFSYIEFQIDDIVRSELVKSYIIAKTEEGF